ncbi:Lcl C-terminal domain-containing protein [Shewanella violacea]|uniref:Lcl C-terminal domain-containing protein n=1 Tax=Shewanella violacea (strain JCM 10179 / CIP 106290 / LMG 19151 / DSS12) TaxID=637905 RepID=D4ZLT2_SHEVD|nr:DUF1566 domain-containing protein [Shewanella violacea]BAJ02631.1 hypothetical protein SVI_2660 [Shewanella violacea DSS12]
MKRNLSPLYLALVCAGLTACGSSDDSSKVAIPEPAKVYSVNFSADTSVDGLVCADSNQNLMCDAGEVQADMTAGVASLSSEDVAVLNNYYLVQSQDAGSDKPMMRYLASAAIADKSEVILNPVSSMVSGLMLNGMTQEKALASIASSLNKQFKLELPADASLLQHHDALTDFNPKFDVMWQAIGAKAAQSPALLAAMSQHLASWAGMTDQQMRFFAKDIVGYASQLNAIYPMTDTGNTLFADGSSFSSEIRDEQFVGQDADYGLDKTKNDNSDGLAGFSYQKLDAKGEALAADAQQWSCVKDLNTGLIWENKTADGISAQDKDHLLVYIKDERAIFQGEIDEASCDDANGICTIAQYQTYLNELEDKQGMCGVKDWQLPSFDQLYSLMNFASTDAGSDGVEMAVDIKYFPNTADNDYWTGTPSVENYASMDQSDYLWTLGFNRWYMGATTSYDYCVSKDDCDYPSALPVRLVGVK